MTWPRYSLRTMLIAMAVAVPVGWLVGLFIRDESIYVDPVTGAVKRTTSYWGITTNEVIVGTELAAWLESRGQGQPPRWQFICSHSWNCIADSHRPPIHRFSYALPLLIERLSEEELLAFVEILRTGDDSQQEAAVRAIQKKYREFN